MKRKRFSSRRRPLSARQRGMAFVATMMILFIVMAALLIGIAANNASGGSGSNGNGLMSTVNNGVTSANARMNSSAAFDLAESGLEYTCEWLSELSAPPDPLNGKSFCPYGWGAFPTNASSTHASVSYGPGTFSVELYPNQANYNNSSNDMGYLVESIGQASGASVIVQAYVWQTNFGHYAYFTNYDDPSGWWVVGLNSFNGPMHSNDTNNNGASFTPTNILWYNNKSTNPMFEYLGSDAYTVSAPSINWNLNNIGTSGSPSTASNWSNIAAGGSNTVQTNTSIVAMPTTSSALETAAWPSTAGAYPTTVGASVPSANGSTDGGIYVHVGTGTLSQMTLSVQNNTTQVITIQQTDPSRPAAPPGNQNVTTTITINQSADTTTVSTVKGSGGIGNTSTTTYNGLTNGVVYVDGNIGTSTNSSSASGGLSGTIADNYTNSNGTTNYWGMTIATPATANTNIDGSIAYNTQPSSSSFATNGATFGLVSDTVDVTQKTAGGTNNNAVTIDGAVLAYNTFQAANYGESFTGTFSLYGSYIAYNAGTFGEVTLAGSLTNGLAESYSYDGRLGVRPPPFFPTTGTVYTIQSWKVASSELQSP